MRHLLLPCVLALVATASTGCGDGRPVTAEPASAAYAGPLVVPAGQGSHPGAGAAGDVVACTTWGRGGTSGEGVYGEGATAGTPEAALDVAASEWLVDGPTEGLLEAARTEDRVLWVLEVDEAVKEAVVVRDGPATEGASGDGWYVESWARCDAAELPRSWTDAVGLLVWTDAATGDPVPTTELEARRGPEHCGWQSTTFLTVDGALYLGRPTPELAENHLAEPYQAHTQVPADAVDTGSVRRGERLWLSEDGRRAWVGRASDAEVWPRARPVPGCD